MHHQHGDAWPAGVVGNIGDVYEMGWTLNGGVRMRAPLLEDLHKGPVSNSRWKRIFRNFESGSTDGVSGNLQIHK